MTQKIRIKQILDDNADQTLVGNVYELERIARLGVAITKCGRIFYEAEYEIISESEAV